MAYSCCFCGKVSNHRADEANRYCGGCHRFERDATLEDLAATVVRMREVEEAIVAAKERVEKLIFEAKPAAAEARRRLARTLVRTGKATPKMVARAADVTPVAVSQWMKNNT